MNEVYYQVVLLGALNQATVQELKTEISFQLVELGLSPHAIRFLSVATLFARKRELPTMGIFFGSQGLAFPSQARFLLEDSNLVVPVVSDVIEVASHIPIELQHINALAIDDVGVPRLATLVFEAFRLLRRERRVFISYRRKESQFLANKLYDELDARGYDVFIDVRSVPPGVDFQAELWHRMGDADVILLIDTPGFRASRWTQEELAQANLTSIEILHLLWPGQSEDDSSAMSTFFPLSTEDFRQGSARLGGGIKRASLRRICDTVEQLRARAIAVRYRYLVDTVCDAARDLGARPQVQKERWALLENSNGERLALVPAIGRPTSDRIDEIFQAINTFSGTPLSIWIVYDGRGMSSVWKRHLDWLNGHLPTRTVPVVDACHELRSFVL
ncbi:TIR domain-containing protein [Rhizobium lentis]|uniref:TIR domain-containing protein n=1 Tax=Rhizobium lentis TaxID=1138194 RepID=UPI001C82C817|nr:TIR domain-containing protein [Rhizobium lentis]MBX5131268.1 TIR domain-containing protein [Rhizobium lentis]